MHTSDPCRIGAPESKIRQYQLLQAIAEMPDLTTCATESFQTLHVYHDGTAWVAEAEAVVSDPTGAINSRTK